MKFTLLFLLLTLVNAQTRLNVNQSDLKVSPIAAVEIKECKTQSTNWDCNGITVIKITLVDGKVIGPLVGVLASPQVYEDSKFVSVPLQ